jgi:hypothetical protein
VDCGEAAREGDSALGISPAAEGTVFGLVRAGEAAAHHFFVRFNRLKLSAPIVETSSGHPEFLGQPIVAPFPRPLSLLGDARTPLRKRKLCPKKLCQIRGSPQTSENKLRTKLSTPIVPEFRMALTVGSKSNKA